MTHKWYYQIRINFSESAAQIMRNDPSGKKMALLAEILKRYDATLRCQFDAFTEYVAEAERQGVENYPLYEWTKETITDSAKKAKYLKSFAVYIARQEVYPKYEADALEADLKSMVNTGEIERIVKYDTDPANNPQPPARSAK